MTPEEKNKLVETALKIAEEAHAGQTREDGKTPYIYHPKAVAKKFVDPVLIAVALLHDVIEDSDLTMEDLIDKGIPAEVAEAVDVLTKRPHQNYVDYIHSVMKLPIARAVKIEDLKHNMKTSYGNRKDKYMLALDILEKV